MTPAGFPRAGLTLLLVVLAALLSSSSSFAQGSFQLSTRASTRNVEVGESFTVQVTALVDKGEPMPKSPMLRVPPGLSVHGPTVASQQQISLSAGQFLQRVGISATWTLEASRPGRFQIGPATVDIGGRRVSGQTVEVQVSRPGTRPRPKQFDPFDPFGMGLPSFPSIPFGSPDDEPEPQLPPYPEGLRLAHAEDSFAFLRAVATPQRAVVGEQITLQIFAYGARGPFRETNTSEPSREAFLAHTLLENSYTETMYRVPVGGDVWHAKKVRELALFPIRAGKLTIGSMRMGFDGRGYPTSGAHKGLVRVSPPLVVEVSEPPLAGRPPGYKLGDVGRFTLTAKVEPRRVSAGEAISVVAKLEGTGNLPYTLRTPQQRGLRWLEPTSVDEIEPRGSVIGGWRKLTYVVHLDEPGEVDLGELTLPYWDPEREAYQVAKARLGKVRVEPSENPKERIPEEDDILAGALTVRKTLGESAARRPPLSDRSWFWIALILAPAAVVLTSAGSSASRRLKERLRQKRESREREAARALSEAASAANDGELAAAASAAERALIASIEDVTGLKARGLLRAELVGELEARGVPEQLSRDLKSLLDDCDNVRFTGSGAATNAQELASRAAGLVRSLSRVAAHSPAAED